MSDFFDDAINRILSHEGGYVNDPRDPGGETKWGISKRSYPTLNIKALTREEAIELYRRDFWNPIQGWTFNEAVSFQLLDAAVNHGMGNAVRFIQRAVGVADDGHVGPITLREIKNTSQCDLLLGINAERLEFYTKLSTWTVYGKGWVRRVAANLRHGMVDSND